MPRVSDVDSVAPDEVVSSQEPKSQPQPESDPESPRTDPGVKEPPRKKSSKNPPPRPDFVGNLRDQIYKILGHTTSPFSSVLVHPDVFNFQEQDDDEKILVVARQHWITNVPWILTAALFALGPSLFGFLPEIFNFPPTYIFVGIIFWYLATFAYAFEKFLSWYFNVYIITTKRIVDIDFHNLLAKKYSDANIDAVQDVTSSVIGAIPTVFNYGNVLIQTASEVNELEFAKVPNPEKIIKVLQELRDVAAAR